MNVYVKLKSIGKNRPILADTPYAIPDGIGSLRQLIEYVIGQEVSAYNQRGIENMLVSFLTEQQIADQIDTGKVSFGRLHTERKASVAKATEAAMIGFSDGLIKVIVGDQEINDLDTPLAINEGDSIVFIRLTFLTGRVW